MDTELAIRAVENAYNAQKPQGELILHSDLGLQYTSAKFQEYMLSKGNIKHSFSHKGCPEGYQIYVQICTFLFSTFRTFLFYHLHHLL